jgi:hypothetical protein
MKSRRHQQPAEIFNIEACGEAVVIWRKSFNGGQRKWQCVAKSQLSAEKPAATAVELIVAKTIGNING